MTNGVEDPGRVRVVGRRRASPALVALALLALVAGAPAPGSAAQSPSVAPSSSPGASQPAAPAADAGCLAGFRDETRLPDAARLMALVGAGDRGVIGVGWRLSGSEPSGHPRLVTAVLGDRGWDFTTSLTPAGEYGVLRAASAGPGGTVWAAGATFQSLARQEPLVLQRTGDSWVDRSPRSVRGVATGIAVDGGGRVWVTTTEVAGTTIRPGLHVLQDGAWRRIGLPKIGGEVRLSAIAAPSRRTIVAVGTTVTAKGVLPVLLVRTGTTWTRERAGNGAGGVIPSAVAVQADGTIAVTGWRHGRSLVEPIQLTRDPNGSWDVQTFGDRTGAAGISLASAGLADRTVAVGGSYISGTGQWVPALGEAGGSGSWGVIVRDGALLQAVAGDPEAAGWVAASPTVKGSERGGFLARVCELSEAGDPAVRRTLVRAREQQVADEMVQARRTAENEAKGSQAARDTQPAGTATEAEAAGPIAGRLVLRDIAADLGLPVRSGSYGIARGDVNGDGRPDLVWSRHGAPMAVYLRTDEGYRAAIGAFSPADRHTCVAVPLDGDAVADIACVTGGQHGLGITSNELYLDPLDPETRDSGTERGLTDPIIRGRTLVALDADGDGDQDLYLAGEERMDGLPEVNRLLENDGDGTFTWDIASRLTSSFGLGIPVAADVDRDGRTDLLVAQHADSVADEPIHLYRNLGGAFTDIAAGVGLRSIDETDVAIAQLGGDARPEIIQLSEDRLVICTWQNGRYVRVVDRAVADGQRVAAGDVDGDGDLDLYVAQGTATSPRKDVLLRNDGDGRSWRKIGVPETLEGVPDDVLAADADGDGRTEFIVVNGRNKAGPFRVIDGVRAPAG